MGRLFGLVALLAFALTAFAPGAVLADGYEPKRKLSKCWTQRHKTYNWDDDYVAYDLYEPCASCNPCYQAKRGCHYKAPRAYREPVRKVYRSHPPQYGHHGSWSQYDYAGHCSYYGCRRTYDHRPHTHVKARGCRTCGGGGHRHHHHHHGHRH